MPVSHTCLKMHNRKSFVRISVSILTLHIIVFFLPVIQAHAAPLPADELRSTITILAKARDRILGKSLEALSSSGDQTTEQQDLLVFVSYLDGRIYYYCEQLFIIDGASALNKSTCPAKQNSGPAASRYMTIPDTSTPTAEEKLADLDSSFEDSLGTFDEMLLKEQQNISAHIKKQREESSRAGTAAYEATGSSSIHASPEDAGKSQGQSTAATAGNKQGVSAGARQQTRIPPTLGNKDLSQSDDDIVAKQLKEAAEQETDPEIKEKLWDEYRKYKEGIR